MGHGGSKPEPSPPEVAPCYGGIPMPFHGQTCHAPAGVDLVNTQLLVSLDRRGPSLCNPSIGEDFYARVQYISRDSDRIYEAKPSNIPDNW